MIRRKVVEIGIIISQRSHVVAHLLDLRKGRGQRYGRSHIGVQSVSPQVLSVLAGEDVFVLGPVGAAIRVCPVPGVGSGGGVRTARRRELVALAVRLGDGHQVRHLVPELLAVGVLHWVLGGLLGLRRLDTDRPPLSGGDSGLGLPRRQVVHEGAPPLALDLPEVARVDHQQRLVADALRWLCRVG